MNKTRQKIIVGGPTIPQCCPTCGENIIWDGVGGNCTTKKCSYIQWDKTKSRVYVSYDGGKTGWELRDKK